MKLSTPIGLSVSSFLVIPVLASFIASSLGQDRFQNAVETYRDSYDYGYQDGANIGVEAKQQNRAPDLLKHKEYQSGLRGFDPDVHEKEIFLVGYRRGFEDGYKQGYELTSKGTVNSSRETMSQGTTNKSHSEPNPATEIIQTLPTGTDIHIELLDRLSTRLNRQGDVFRARVAREVTFLKQLLIPRGTQIKGKISHLKRAGRVRGRAQIGLRFEELRFLDGRILPFEATIVALQNPQDLNVKTAEGIVEANSNKKRDLGTVMKSTTLVTLIGLGRGGKKGAGRGAAGGALGGLGQVLWTRGKDAHLEPRSKIQIRLTEDLELIH